MLNVYGLFFTSNRLCRRTAVSRYDLQYERPVSLLFKAGNGSRLTGINRSALLIVNTAIKPEDYNIIAAEIDGEFRLVRFRCVPVAHFEELGNSNKRRPLKAEETSEEEKGMCYVVITPVLNDVWALSSVISAGTGPKPRKPQKNSVALVTPHAFA